MTHLSPSDVGRGRRKLVKDLVCHILHEPLEALALMFSLELKLFSDVTDVIAFNGRLTRVKVFFEFII